MDPRAGTLVSCAHEVAGQPADMPTRRVVGQLVESEVISPTSRVARTLVIRSADDRLRPGLTNCTSTARVCRSHVMSHEGLRLSSECARCHVGESTVNQSRYIPALYDDFHELGDPLLHLLSAAEQFYL